MQIIKVQYGKTFSLGNYCSERVDMEATIDEHDDAEDIIGGLKARVEAFHKANNPHLYQEQTPIVEHKDGVYWTHKENGSVLVSDQPPVQELKITPEEGRAHTIAEIQKCTTLKKLNDWKLISKTHPDTKEAYDNKLKELNNG